MAIPHLFVNTQLTSNTASTDFHRSHRIAYWGHRLTDIFSDNRSAVQWKYIDTFTYQRDYVSHDSDATGVSSQSGLPLALGPSGPALPSASVPRGAQLAAKHVLDWCGALLLTALLSPLLLAIALLVKLSGPGPVLFTQLRDGQHGKPFRIFKFRTMHTAAGDASGVAQTVVGDGRITRLGQSLRRTNLDELPQLFNILRGEMSFIGPRPHPLNMLAAGRRYDEHVPYYGARLLMRPGISGWAQCNGLRGPTTDGASATARIDHDLAYIQNFSLLLDFKAAWRTVAREASGGTGF